MPHQTALSRAHHAFWPRASAHAIQSPAGGGAHQKPGRAKECVVTILPVLENPVRATKGEDSMAQLAVTGHEMAQETKDRLAAQQFQPLSDSEHHSSRRSEPLEFTAPRTARGWSSGLPRSGGVPPLLSRQPRRGIVRGTSPGKTRCCRSVRAQHNPSLKRSANGRPPGPVWRYAVHFRQPGPGVLPSPPA